MAPRLVICVLCVTLVLTLSPSVRAQVRAGDLTGWSQLGNTVTLTATEFRTHLRFINERMVRVDVLPFAASQPESSVVVVATTSTPLLPIVETDSTLVVTGGSLVVRIRKRPLRLTFEGPLPRSLLTEPDDGGASALGDHRTLSFELGADDRIYGSGPRGIALNLRGTAFDLWNTQTFGYGGPLATMNANVPLFLFSTNMAVLVDHWYRGRADLGATREDRWSYDVAGGEVAYYVMTGTSYQDLIDLSTQLTGRPSLPPRWTLGYIQSKFGYQNATEARAVVASLRSLSIPADGLVLDLYWFNKMGDLSWNAGAWPDPAGLLAELRASGIKTITITEPYIIESAALFGEGQALGHFGKNSIGNPWLIPNWWSCNCNAALVDLTSPEARAWWWSKHPAFLNAGVAALWTDLGEPESHPDGMLHRMGSAGRIHNLYGLLWARTMAEGWSSYRPNERLFNLTRSGWAGSQRSGAALWSGDVSKSFGGLAPQANMMLNAGLSGLGWFHSDIGGFCCGTSPAELYIRWMQFGTFAPIMRAHGTGGPTEPWGFGDQALTIARDLIRLRYQLLPYWYSLAYEHATTGIPPVRPLFLSDPTDPFLAGESRAWMVGHDILVAPVVQDGARSVSFRLPAGLWVDWWTGARLDGGRDVTVAAPLDRIPLFVRSGSIIPLGPVMRWSDERPLDTLTFVVHPHPLQSPSTSLYEDDGFSNAYKTGAFNQTSIEQGWADINGQTAMVFQLTSSGGLFAGKTDERAVVLDVRQLELAPLSVNVNGRLLSPFATWDQVVAAGEGGTFDAAGGRLRLLFRTSGDSAYQVIMTDTRVTSLASVESVPDRAELDQNYPNPFNAETRIGYRTARAGWVEVTVVDILGRTVATIESAWKEAGISTTTWNAGAWPSGVYFCRLRAGEEVVTRRMILLK